MTIAAMDGERRSPVFLMILALAHIGGVIGYLPLLGLLLPIRTDAIAGDARLGVFTATVVAGALAASGANILFGWLSDRSIDRGGGRRRWLAWGVVATVLGHAGVALAATPVTLVVAVALFQAGVNALLAPLFAIMADEIPDGQKGVAGGLLAMAMPAAAAMVAALALVDERTRFAILPVTIALCTLPLLLTRSRRTVQPEPERPAQALRSRQLWTAWLARLLVQIAANVLFFYLSYYLGSIAPELDQAAIAARMGSVLLVAYLISFPIALVLGQFASRTGRTRSLLLAAVGLAAAGLLGMALADGFLQAALAFCAYATGAAVFQSLQTAFAMRLLPSPRRRGRDLGLFNLANTLPALIGPVLTWTLATPGDFHLVLLVLAGLTVTGGLIMPRVQPQPAG